MRAAVVTARQAEQNAAADGGRDSAFSELSGLAIAVVKDGEIVLARGYALCEIGKDRKVSADTAFNLASSAKERGKNNVGVWLKY